jgi:hypothetical protein
MSLDSLVVEKQRHVYFRGCDQSASCLDKIAAEIHWVNQQGLEALYKSPIH